MVSKVQYTMVSKVQYYGQLVKYSTMVSKVQYYGQ